MRHLAPLVLLALAACAPDSDPAEGDGAPASDRTTAATAPSPAVLPGAAPTPEAEARADVLRLEGLGDLAIGEPIPSGSSFAVRGAQIPGSNCKTAGSPDYPGVYALLEGDRVRRITVGDDADLALVEGIGVGASEAEVMQAFPGFRASPHKYVEAPAKYLTQPGTDPRLRFEIGRDGRVTLIHVGTMPQLAYVEGCA